MGSTNPHRQADPRAIEDYDGDNGEKKGKVFKPRGLNIIWGKDARYWNVPDSESKSAELLQVCWLEVTGCADNIDPQKDCEVIFELSLTADAFGWGGCPVYVMVKRGKEGKFASKKYILTSFNNDSEIFKISCKLMKGDKENQVTKKDTKVYFGLYEVWSRKWKGGLKIHRAIVKELP